MTRGSVRDYAATQRERYRRAGKRRKKAILDEFVFVTGYHRKAAIRILRQPAKKAEKRSPRGRPRVYGPAVTRAAEKAWEACGRIGSRRLKPFLGELWQSLEKHGEVNWADAATRSLLMQASPATLDRLLRRARQGQQQRKVRGKSHGNSYLRGDVPVRTFAEHDEQLPGCLEIDLVLHCGSRSEGFYHSTLTAVDLRSGWVELEAVWGQGSMAVLGALHRIRRRLPMQLWGLDCDNGSEFINHAFVGYCRASGIKLTRSRPYKKNDNAWVEQKNGAVVRRLVGHGRLASRAAFTQLELLYEQARLQVNFFQPVARLVDKHWEGSTQRRTYDDPKTPYQRLKDSGVLHHDALRDLEALYQSLNAAALAREIEAMVDNLIKLHKPRPSVTRIMSQQNKDGNSDL